MSKDTHSRNTRQIKRNLELDDILIAEMPLRSSGWVGYSADAIIINDDDDDYKKIYKENIAEIGLRTLQWDMAVMSILLAGVGGYIILTQNPLIGLCFALVGLGSLYRTYTNRYALIIQSKNHHKPVTIHPTHPKECHEQLAEKVELNLIR